MARRIGLMLMAGVALGSAAVSTAPAQDPRTVEKKILAEWNKHRSMTAKMTRVSRDAVPSGTIELKARGTCEITRQAGKTLIRMDYLFDTRKGPDGKTEKVHRKLTAIGNGEHLHLLVEYERDGKVRTSAVKQKVFAEDCLDPKLLFERLRSRPCQLTLLPEQTLDGRKVYVIEATRVDAGQLRAKMVFLFLQEGGAVAKSVIYRTPRATLTTTFSDFKFDVELNPKRFAFEPPEGVEVHDQTAPPTTQEAPPEVTLPERSQQVKPSKP